MFQIHWNCDDTKCFNVGLFIERTLWKNKTANTLYEQVSMRSLQANVYLYMSKEENLRTHFEFSIEKCFLDLEIEFEVFFFFY